MWDVVAFGKYQGKGKTLPQVVFDDPDWFFWALENGAFRETLAVQADEVGRKAQNIKIPGNDNGELVAEYVMHTPTNKFAGLEIVPKSQTLHSGSRALRRDRIDLGIVRRFKKYDKAGGKLLVGCVKHILFGAVRARLTRQRCEEFFDDPKNFVP